MTSINYKGIIIKLSIATDLYISIDNNEIILQSIADKLVSANVTGSKSNKIENIEFEKAIQLKPGKKIICFL